MISLIFKMLCIILTLMVFFTIWDISRYIYCKVKSIIVEILKGRKIKKLKTKDKPVVSAQSNIVEQYSAVLERVGEYEQN